MLHSLVNGRAFGIGHLVTPSLNELSAQTADVAKSSPKLKVTNVYSDVRQMHRSPEYAGSTFQAASQFNLLEMVSPTVTPEHGVTGYQSDNTQGPACAITAGAGTIYRNYFAPIAGGSGQTSDRQLGMLADLGTLLSQRLSMTVDTLYRMRNGYALASRDGLSAIREHLASCGPSERDALRGSCGLDCISMWMSPMPRPSRSHV